MLQLFSKHFLSCSDVSGTVLCSNDSKWIKTCIQTSQSSYRNRGDRLLTCDKLPWLRYLKGLWKHQGEVTNPAGGQRRPHRASASKCTSAVRHRHGFEKHRWRPQALTKVGNQELSHWEIRNTLDHYITCLLNSSTNVLLLKGKQGPLEHQEASHRAP